MYLKISEYCAWEKEKWSYVIDLNKQSGIALNWLFIFTRLANEQFLKVKTEMQNKWGAGSPFAASCYTTDFYENVDTTDPDYIRCSNNKGMDSLLIKREGSYKEAGQFFQNGELSCAMSKRAAVRMRDKKENILYKDFESIFTKKSISAGK